jgi:hypothetical protein
MKRLLKLFPGSDIATTGENAMFGGLPTIVWHDNAQAPPINKVVMH